MCGIAGFVSKRPRRFDDLPRMSDALVHRGPDGFGFAFLRPGRPLDVRINRPVPPDLFRQDGTMGLAHRRLSIIDLSAASAQPFVDASGSTAIVFNGEVYNFPELRDELKSLGHVFRTEGDTEVLLQAYQAWGPDFLRRLNGMWALAIYDGRRRRAILSRDRFGIKPLYYAVTDETLYFASEVKALLAVPAIDKKPNERIVSRYVSSGRSDAGNETFFEGIYQFPAGHWASLDLEAGDAALKPVPYWDFPRTTYRGDVRRAIDEFRALFLDAVRVHIRSDVPVGTCLSGGLDSSSIVCAADHLRKSNALPSYTHTAFGYCPPEENLSERSFMEVVARATDIRLDFVKVPEAEFLETIPDIVSQHDEPFGSASIAAQWFLFRRAREAGMTVMLDGQGADEILGGYHEFFLTVAREILRRGRLISFGRFAVSYEKNIGPLWRFLPALVGRSLPFSRRFRNAVWTGRLLAEPLRRCLRKDFESPRREASLNEQLESQVRSDSLPALLRYEDRNSMAHSIEARVPFLDPRIVEFVFSLPEDWKIRGTKTKYILREAMRGILPDSIRTRTDKVGFRASPGVSRAFVRRHSQNLAGIGSPYERRWFQAKAVERFFTKPGPGQAREFLLWRLINLKLWARRHWPAADGPGADPKIR